MNKKRVGVTGAGGYIGQALMRQPNMVPIEGDIRDLHRMEMEIGTKKPDLIIHLAALTDTDFCERRENEITVTKVNVHGTFDLADRCQRHGIGMVFLSTFQVFSGKKMFGSSFAEKDTPAPVNFYGMSKLTAEAYNAVYDQMKIIRAPYVYDWSRLYPHIEVLERMDVHYPTFMKRSFMHLNHFIESLLCYVEKFEQMPPILHLSTFDTESWCEFMCDVVDKLEIENAALPRKDELPSFTRRPHKGGLNPSLSYTYGFPMYSIMDGINLLKEGL